MTPTPLELFTRQLPTMPLERIEKVLESLKGSVGGGAKGKVESEVSGDFRIAIENELARRRNGMGKDGITYDEQSEALAEYFLADEQAKLGSENYGTACHRLSQAIQQAIEDYLDSDDYKALKGTSE